MGFHKTAPLSWRIGFGALCIGLVTKKGESTSKGLLLKITLTFSSYCEGSASSCPLTWAVPQEGTPPVTLMVLDYVAAVCP